MIYGLDRDYISYSDSQAELLVPEYRNIPVGALGRGWPISVGTPIVARQYKTCPLPDMFIVGTACGINERLRDVIESVEPGVHQYLPLLMLQKNGKEIPGKFFMLNVCQSFEADLFPDLSKRVFVKLHSPFDQPRVSYYDGERTFSRPQIAGRHFWTRHACACGTSDYAWSAYMSDVMFNAWKKAKIKYFNYRKNKNGFAEVDVPWVAEEQVPEAVAWFRQAVSDMKAGRENTRVGWLATRPRGYQHWLQVHLPELLDDFTAHMNDETFLKQSFANRVQS
jgi:hypothetical protein